MAINIGLQVRGAEQVKWALQGLKKDIQTRAITRWTNWIGIEAQAEMRQQIPSRFSFRGTADGFRQAIVFAQAKQTGDRTRQAVLKVGGPGFGQSRTEKLGRILARHEEAGARTEAGQTFFDGRGRAMTGLGFFLPASGMRTPSTNPARNLYPKAIGAALRRTPDDRPILAKGTRKGSKRTGTGTSFFATRMGIFRRRHTRFGRANVEAIWWFRRAVRTPARLGLQDTANRVVRERAIPLGLQAIDETLTRFAAGTGEFAKRGGR